MTGAAERILAEAPIVRPGRNCWRVERADRFLCIHDAADYFRLVRQAILRAQRTVFTLGWDTSAHTDLLPGERPSDGPKRLDRLLAHVARRRPDIQCYVLTWDYGVVHMLERDPFTRWRLGWRTPSNVLFAFDDHHAIGGCHHQKVVVIDDQIAFAGGIDLTGHRWDTAAHRVNEPSRISLDGDVYGPYHEVQAMVSGPIAAALGDLARRRWQALGSRDLPSVSPSCDDLWPDGVPPDLTDVSIAISRTMPALDDAPAVRECETLFADSIAAARRTIYIESQYFTDNRLAEVLAGRLRASDGPEVIVVTPRDCTGWLEQKTMGAFRDTVLRQLIDADAHGRLRIVYPAASQSRDVPIFVHAKVMFVDDRLARIGSSNFSKRSMGVDSECDLAVEADDDPEVRAGIMRMRDGLIAEHLGLAVEAVTREIAARGSIRGVIDAHADADRTLVRVPVPASPEPPSEVLLAAADPAEPVASEHRPSGPLGIASVHRTSGYRVVGAVAVLAGGIGYALAHASPPNRRALVLAPALLVATVAGVRWWTFARRARRAVSSHRRRAEFG